MTARQASGRFLTYAEAQAMYGVGRSKLQRLVVRGEIVAYRPGKSTLLDHASVEEWVASTRITPARRLGRPRKGARRCFNGAGAGWPRKTARSSTGQGRWLAGQVARGVATPAGGTPQTYSTNIQFQRLFHFQRT